MLVALTGGIGSGKSTVLDLFEDLGAKVEDTDTIVHNIYKEDEQVHSELRQRWGNKVFKGNSPDRKAIAGLVFNDKNELNWLNELMHPKVRERISSNQPENIKLIAVPLLYEVKWQTDFDTVISVWCSTNNQMTRLRGRGWSDSEIHARTSAQLDQSDKLARADYGIINNWSLNSLNRQCRLIYTKLHNKEL